MTVLNTERIVFTARPLPTEISNVSTYHEFSPGFFETSRPRNRLGKLLPPFEFLQIQQVICGLGFPRRTFVFPALFRNVFPTGFAGIKFTCIRALHPVLPPFIAAAVRSRGCELREARKISSPSPANRTCIPIHTLLTPTLGA